MSSKERVLFAMALFIDNDKEQALNIYHRLNAGKGSYLLQGEVKSDLAIMKQLLGFGGLDRND